MRRKLQSAERLADASCIPRFSCALSRHVLGLLLLVFCFWPGFPALAFGQNNKARSEERGATSDAPSDNAAVPSRDYESDVENVPVPDYPRDPSWPTWTPANDPAKQPIFAPAGEYDLVRPPQGILQHIEGNEYRRVVGSEEDLIYDWATNPPPISMLRPDGMAPAGVFGDHTLNTGGRILMAYRFNTQDYQGLLSGTRSVSTAGALGAFPLVPTHETAQTHYFTFEYGPTDDITFLATLPIVLRNIHYVDGMGNQQLTDVTDLYDISIYANYVLFRQDRQQVHANLGVRIPTGVFVELTDQNTQPVPSPTSPFLTYPMRTSDGTWDFLPGLTYRGQSDYWTWGLQGLGTVRFGINKYGYRLGDDATLNFWLARKLTDSISASARLNAQWWGNIFGADQRLNPNLVPTNRTDLQGGDRLNLLFGLNYMVPDGIFQGQRLGVEGGFPIYQSLSGPQLQQRYEIWANLSIQF